MDYKIYFKQYKTNLSLLALKNIELEQAIRDIFDAKEVGIAAQVITDMPGVHNPTSKVEQQAVKTEKELQELHIIKTNIDNEIFDLEQEIKKVEAIWSNLYQREVFIAKQFYIEGLPWPLVSKAYEKEYGFPLQKSQIFEILNEANKKMKLIS